MPSPVYSSRYYRPEEALGGRKVTWLALYYVMVVSCNHLCEEFISMSHVMIYDIHGIILLFRFPLEQRFHGEKELFDSDHADEVHKGTIIGKAFVHSLKKYEVFTMLMIKG